jgi:fatty-acid desaturase
VRRFARRSISWRIPEVSFFKRDRTFNESANWITIFFVFIFHLNAVAALFFFTWKGLVVAVVLSWVAGSLGIGIGYHRLLTHRGFKAAKWVEYALTVCGTLALEGGPIAWVATHRMHHQNTDKEGDPHSPRDGGLWAHMGWILTGKAMHNGSGKLSRLFQTFAKTSSMSGSANGTGHP